MLNPPDLSDEPEGQGGGAYIQKKGRHESLAPASQRIMLINVRFCQI